MKPVPSSSKTRSQKKKHDLGGHTDLVTYEVFKRVYWPCLWTKGLCTSFVPIPLCSLTSGIKHRLSRSANLLVQSIAVPAFLSSRDFAFLGTIKGSEKSLDSPNHALDKDAYENLRNNHRVDYALFEAYQRLKSKRGERDLADRFATPYFAALRLTISNSRTHRLLDELKANGLKGEPVDFLWVEFTFYRIVVKRVTN